MNRVFLLIFCAAWCFGACATTEAARDPVAQMTYLKTVHPAPGNATLVIYKNTSFTSVFGAEKSTIFVNEMPVGDVTDNTFAVIHLKPGKYGIRSFAPGLRLTASVFVSLKPSASQALELQANEAFGSRHLDFQPRPFSGQTLDDIARDCTLAFNVDFNVDSPPSEPKPAVSN